MYKIACWDTDSRFLEDFYEICSDIFRRFHIDYQLDTFTSFDELYDKCIQTPRYYSLLVLDVMIPENDSENGIDFAKKLRSCGVSSSILLISSSKDYILDGYEVQALHYMLKPLEPALLEKILLKDYRTNYMQQRLILSKGSCITYVYLKDILYIESIRRTTLIHTVNDIVTCNLHLDDLFIQLPPTDFVRCHQSYIVNLSYVTILRRYEAVLKDLTVPVSKSHYKAVQSNFIRFLREGGSL